LSWTSSAPLIVPRSDASHDLVAVKDPTVVRYNDRWHVYASSVARGGVYGMVYTSFTDWSDAPKAPLYYMDRTRGFNTYVAAPQLFYFTPQKKWYLVYQSGPPQYSTNDDVGNPAAWTAPKSFFASEPATVTQTKGATGGWLDFWVICDDASCFLFFSDDAGHWYRSQTAVADFPNGFGEAVVVLRDDANPTRVYEASNVYKLKGLHAYLALIEAFDADSGQHRYFRSWTATALDGDWTPLQDEYGAPFASAANVIIFPEQPPWTQDISHGEMIRDGIDQQLTIDTCNLQYLYQGLDPASVSLPYNSLPWRLGRLDATLDPSP
jgi:hypothetical protein